MQKTRTERVGIGVTLNLNLEISDVDCECNFEFEENAEETETEVLMSALDNVESVITPQLAISITDTDALMEILSPDSAAARSRKRKSKKPKRLEPRLNVVREKSPFGKLMVYFIVVQILWS